MRLNSPLVLLSGCVGFGEEYTRVEGFSNRHVGAVCLKGTTLSARLGNQPHRVWETPAGMLYRVVRKGSGRSPAPKDSVRLHYTGWLQDGTEIATSYDRKRQPHTIGMSKMIGGLARGLQFTQEGGVIELIIPGHLAYGEEGRKPLIRPNATLVYVAELIQVF